MKAIVSMIAAAALCVAMSESVRAHDIYTGLRNKQGFLCCGGSDCAVTKYRETGSRYEFLTREQEWVEIPSERIIFLPVPGDTPSADSDEHRAHLCYRKASDYDRQANGGNVFSDIYLYCAFIPPGSI